MKIGVPELEGPVERAAAEAVRHWSATAAAADARLEVVPAAALREFC
jgi:hypothetical protein